MADKVKLWFDSEADYLEVQFKEAPGFMKETAHDAVMERVDSQGNVIYYQPSASPAGHVWESGDKSPHSKLLPLNRAGWF